MAKAKTANDGPIDIVKINQGVFRAYVIGESPFICHRLSLKARQQLLAPSGKKNNAEKVSSIKHDPYEEFRSSPYTNKYDNGHTRLQLLGTMFKGAIKSAALDMPGIKKSEIGRLCYIAENRIDLFGLPELFMAVVRSADMQRTPDVRTRMIVPRWAASFTVKYVEPNLRGIAVANLLAAAGTIVGVGDYRVEKGAGSYGRFRLVNSDNEEFLDIVNTGGRIAQDNAIANPVCYDDETEELLSWFNVESNRRGFKVV